MGSKRLTEEVALQRVEENKSDRISIIGYVNGFQGSKTKFTVRCNDCSFEWESLYDNILKGKSCRKCKYKYNKNKFDKDLMISRAKEVHGDKYLYHEVDYVRCRDKVEIVCPEHGSFFQSFDNHINKGKGCRGCRDYPFKSIEEFLKDFNQKGLNGISIYEDTYTEAGKPLKLNCSVHGDFTLTKAQDALRYKYVCQQCSYENTERTLYKNFDDFIKKAKEVSNPDFEYIERLDDFNGFYDKRPIKVLCQKHGVFETTPNAILSGKYGCKGCAKDRRQEIAYNYTFNKKVLLERNKSKLMKEPCYVYLLKYSDIYKIGISKDLDSRLYNLNRELGYVDLEYLGYSNRYYCSYLEIFLFEMFKEKRLCFNESFGGHTEFFTLSDKDVTIVKTILDKLTQEV